MFRWLRNMFVRLQPSTDRIVLIVSLKRQVVSCSGSGIKMSINNHHHHRHRGGFNQFETGRQNNLAELALMLEPGECLPSQANE